MKVVRNVTLVALLAAAPFALAHRGEGESSGPGGCPGAQGQTQGMQERHAGNHARMATMHQGMGPGMHQGAGQGFAPRFGEGPKTEEKK